MEWEGHTDAFREEVADWVRKDRGLQPGAYTSALGAGKSRATDTMNSQESNETCVP